MCVANSINNTPCSTGRDARTKKESFEGSHANVSPIAASVLNKPTRGAAGRDRENKAAIDGAVLLLVS